MGEHVSDTYKIKDLGHSWMVYRTGPRGGTKAFSMHPTREAAQEMADLVNRQVADGTFYG